MTARLTRPLASRFAEIALGHVAREYPNKVEHVMADADDVRGPRALHPVFYGSFDWHSCVHGYWTLARLWRRFPDLPEAARIRVVFDAHLVPEKVAGELAYLERKESATFERPYGWAWLLKLFAELSLMTDEAGRRWAAALEPLVRAFAARFLAFLPKATYPVRVGTHFNSAFALVLALDYAEAVGHEALAEVVCDKARRWYDGDRDCQAWEPGGDDFLSPALVEAECMRRVLDERPFLAWLDGFLPRLAERSPVTLFTPATVSDRSDGKIVHLDGLNLSRAWCWRSLAAALPDEDARRPMAQAAARAHLERSLPHVSGDYMGEHWLATYAVLALEA
jgi:hypothetical protein